MFGYVTISKEQLTEEEYKIFSAYYCGVCKATGRRASQAARLGLNYDITFLALVLASLTDENEDTEIAPCIAHPIKKREYVQSSRAVDYAAEVGVILEYLKLKDDFSDDRSIKAGIGMAFMHGGYRRSSKSNYEVHSLIERYLEKLSDLENQNSSSVDETADSFAEILKLLFVPDFIDDKNDRRILSWLGYNLGRWIYIIDAYNDIERDFNKKSYNPFLADGGDPEQIINEIKPEIEFSLTFTLENIASAFELLKFRRNESLIGKIIYTGLKQMQSFVLENKAEEQKRGWLKRRNNII